MRWGPPSICMRVMHMHVSVKSRGTGNQCLSLLCLCRSLSLLVSLFVHDLMHHVPSGVHDVSFMCSLFLHRQCALIEFQEASHAMRHDHPRSATCSCMQWNWDVPCHAPDWQFMSRPCIFHACRMCHFLFLQIQDSASFDSQRERERARDTAKLQVGKTVRKDKKTERNRDSQETAKETENLNVRQRASERHI